MYLDMIVRVCDELYFQRYELFETRYELLQTSQRLRSRFGELEGYRRYQDTDGN